MQKKESPAQFSSFVVKSQPGVSQDCLGRQSFGWDQHQQPGVRIADDKIVTVTLMSFYKSHCWMKVKVI